MRKDYNNYTLKDLEADIAKTDAILSGRNFESRVGRKDMPSGANGMPTALLFEERLFYKEGAFHQIENRDNGMVDRWNTILEYGKSDSSGVAIYPREYYLKQITSAQNELFAFNFVVDVFEEMSDFLERYAYQAAHGIKGSRDGSPFIPLNATRAWESASTMYNDHIGELYKSLTNDYLSGKHSKILTFDHFVDHFIKFCRVIASTVPINFSSFIESGYCPININGLTIEIASDGYDDDRTKFESFVQHEHFELYRYAAQIHGFMIDKNTPWRLYANMAHPKMIESAKRTILLGDEPKIKNIMRKAYLPAEKLDMFLLKFHLPAFYNSYIKFMPIVDTPIAERCAFSGVKIKNSQAFRSPVKAFNIEGKIDPNSLYHEHYNERWWLNFYHEMKNIENGYRMPKNELMRRTQKIMYYYDSFGFDKAIEKINFDIRLQRGNDNLKRGMLTKASPNLVISNELATNPDRRQSGAKYTLEIEERDGLTGEVLSTTPVSNGTGGPQGFAGGTVGSSGTGGGGGGGY